jgi:uncharacterized membrane protein YsdA (DUF1294 family)
MIAMIAAAALLVLPMTAAGHQGLAWLRIAGYAALASGVAYAIKRLAQRSEWRVSEAQLHFWELIGGWLGSWIAQRVLRHKCSKGSYQFVFWLIVISQQFAALDSFQDWKASRAGWKWIERTSVVK